MAGTAIFTLQIQGRKPGSHETAAQERTMIAGFLRDVVQAVGDGKSTGGQIKYDGAPVGSWRFENGSFVLGGR